MELKQLNYLIVIAEAGSLSLAAQRVGLTQQALSKSLAKLESTVGGPLLVRDPRGVSLTPLGKIVERHARDLISKISQLEHAIDQEIGYSNGSLCIGLGPIASTSWIADYVSTFAQKYPQVSIEVAGGIDRKFSEDIHLGRLDLAIAAQTEPFDETIKVEHISNEPWGVVGRVGNKTLESATNLGDLRAAQWIAGQNSALLGSQVEADFQGAGIPLPSSNLETSSVLFALNAIAKSDYLSILPYSVSSISEQLHWVQFSKNQWLTPLYLLRHRRAPLSKIANQFIRGLQSRRQRLRSEPNQSE
jgi:DNA-binding transcriptional LysR family regulator